MDVNRHKSVGTQTSFEKEQEDKSKSSPGNVWSNVCSISTPSTQTSSSSSDMFAEMCDKVLASEDNSDYQVNVLSSAMNKLDTKEGEKSGEISKSA